MLSNLLKAINWDDMELRQNKDKDGNQINKHYLSYHVTVPNVEFERGGTKLASTRVEITVLARNVGSPEERATKRAESGVKAATTRIANQGPEAVKAAIDALMAKLA